MTPTRENLYPGQGYGFSWVGVRVGLAYPRVTHDIPYGGASFNRHCLTAGLYRFGCALSAWV